MLHDILVVVNTIALLVIAASAAFVAVVIARCGQQIIRAARSATTTVNAAHELVRRAAPELDALRTEGPGSPRWADLISRRRA